MDKILYSPMLPWKQEISFLLFISCVIPSVISTYPYYYPYYDYNNRNQHQQTTKCSYSIIVNEISGSKCPELMRQIQNQNDQRVEPQPPRRMRQRHPPLQSTPDVQDLKNELKTLELDFYREIVRIKESNTTLKDMENRITTTEQKLSYVEKNSTQVSKDMKLIDQRLVKQWEYIQSLEKKIMEAITNIGEVQLMLSKRLPKLGDMGEKEVMVEAASKARNCGMGEDAKYYTDCHHIWLSGHRTSGVYYVTPIYSACPIPVWCDMDTPTGGYLVIARRSDGSTDFNRGWLEYRQGFGDLSNEFWLGNDNIFLLTNQANFRLRVDLWDFKGSRVYAEYEKFVVDGERNNYRLHIGNYSGTAGEGLYRHDGLDFSTPDNDNDVFDEYHCARVWRAGWWFTNCWYVFLTGDYYNTTDVKYKGIAWGDWKLEQLFRAEMKIIPNMNAP